MGAQVFHCDNTEMKPCWKDTFETKGEAEKEARQRHRLLKQRRREKGECLRAYQCVSCRKFHLTSKKRT